MLFSIHNPPNVSYYNYLKSIYLEACYTLYKLLNDNNTIILDEI